MNGKWEKTAERGKKLCRKKQLGGKASATQQNRSTLKCTLICEKNVCGEERVYYVVDAVCDRETQKLPINKKILYVNGFLTTCQTLSLTTKTYS